MIFSFFPLQIRFFQRLFSAKLHGIAVIGIRIRHAKKCLTAKPFASYKGVTGVLGIFRPALCFSHFSFVQIRNGFLVDDQFLCCFFCFHVIFSYFLILSSTVQDVLTPASGVIIAQKEKFSMRKYSYFSKCDFSTR